MSFASALPRIGTPVVSVTCQITLSVFSLMYMHKTIDPITLTSWSSCALILTVGGDSLCIVIPDQRVHVLYRVASHCILPLYQFQCPPGAS